MNTDSEITQKFTSIHSKLPKIVVLGLGGAGSNAVNRMIENGMQGVTFVAANTDAQALSSNLAPNKIQLGPRSTRGLGAGGLPTIGETAAEESYRELVSILEGAEMVFLTAGMGGGTGTGSIPIAAKVAKAVGAVTVAIVTKPFYFELGRRQKNAEIGLKKLRQYTDTLIVIPNDRLIDVAPRDLPLEMAFSLADDVLRQGVQGIAELITETGIINVDFAHIKHIMQRGGGALMAVGTGEGPHKVDEAIHKALHHPLLEEVDLASASAMIANFTGGDDLTFREITEAMQTLQASAKNHAEIIPGVINDPRMKDRAQVILIVTGVAGINIEEAFTRIEQNRTNIKEDFIFPVNKPDHETSILQHSQPQKNPNQYMPQVDFNKNLDIPAFLRKRIQITQ